MLASNVFAYTVITDPSVFYAFFEKPASVIDFTKLKDGTSYDSIPGKFEPDTFKVAEPDCINNHTEDFQLLGLFGELIRCTHTLFVMLSCGLIKEYQPVTSIWLCQQMPDAHSPSQCTQTKDLWVLFRIPPKKLFSYLKIFTLYSVLKQSSQRRHLSLKRRLHFWQSYNAIFNGHKKAGPPALRAVGKPGAAGACPLRNGVELEAGLGFFPVWD
jgi:hypothetical protein